MALRIACSSGELSSAASGTAQNCMRKECEMRRDLPKSEAWCRACRGVCSRSADWLRIGCGLTGCGLGDASRITSCIPERVPYSKRGEAAVIPPAAIIHSGCAKAHRRSTDESPTALDGRCNERC
jgi:hypothetical protein